MAYTTINKSTDYFNTVTYTGTGSALNLTVGFQPDMYWIKSRSNAHSHVLGDAVRGIGNGTSKVSHPDLTAAEATCASGQGITGVTSTQLQLGSETNTSGSTNGASKTYVAWNWKANGGTGSSNTDGSITSTVSANTTSGFSIVSFTGTGSNATVGHGLGTAPSLIIQKARDSVLNWKVYHKSLGATKYINFDEANPEGTASTIWNDTEPTTSVYSLGTGNTNTSSVNYIAYCFNEVKGFSKFGKYTGNGNADGTFVYTGFKPAWIIQKATTGAGLYWYIRDTKRSSYNVADQKLAVNLADAESSDGNNTIDILSNGFKNRTSLGHTNSSGTTYIYMAFASAPLVGSNNIPCTAR